MLLSNVQVFQVFIQNFRQGSKMLWTNLLFK